MDTLNRSALYYEWAPWRSPGQDPLWIAGWFSEQILDLFTTTLVGLCSGALALSGVRALCHCLEIQNLFSWPAHPLSTPTAGRRRVK